MTCCSTGISILLCVIWSWPEGVLRANVCACKRVQLHVFWIIGDSVGIVQVQVALFGLCVWVVIFWQSRASYCMSGAKCERFNLILGKTAWSLLYTPILMGTGSFKSKRCLSFVKVLFHQEMLWALSAVNSICNCFVGPQSETATGISPCNILLSCYHSDSLIYNDWNVGTTHLKTCSLKMIIQPLSTWLPRPSKLIQKQTKHEMPVFVYL